MFYLQQTNCKIFTQCLINEIKINFILSFAFFVTFIYLHLINANVIDTYRKSHHFFNLKLKYFLSIYYLLNNN
jgi:hypothetical protein